MAEQSVKIGASKRAYSTSFTTDQSTLSEGGVWRPRVNTVLTDFLVSGGKAIGKATGLGDFDDSAAHLSGFGPNVEITATIFRDPSLNESATHETELLIRFTASGTTISLQYECLFNFQGGIQFVLWFNNGGSQGFSFIGSSSGPESLGRDLITGDRIKVRCEGSTFTLSVIEADNTVHVLGVYNDSTYSTGQPGIGAFTRQGDGGDCADLCFQDVLITEL